LFAAGISYNFNLRVPRVEIQQDEMTKVIDREKPEAFKE